jgi:hypothetical protein
MAGNVQRRLNVVLGVDAGPMGPGLQQGAARLSEFTAEIHKVDSELERASARYAKSVSEAAKLKQQLQSVGRNPLPADVEALRGRYAEAKGARSAAEGGLDEAVARKREATEKELLRERILGMQREADLQYKAKEDEALYVKTSMAEISRVEQESLQAARLATDKKTSLALGEYNTRVALEQRYYELTASQRDIELVRLRDYYGKLRGQYSGNASMVAQIDKTYAEELAQRGVGGGFWGPLAGRGRTFKAAGRLAAVQAMSTVGPPELAQASGFGMMSYMSMAGQSGALGMGLGIGAMALGAYAIKGSLAEIAATRKQITAWTKEEEKSAQNIRDAFAWKPETTGVGDVYRAGAEAERQAVTEGKDRAKAYEESQPGLWGSFKQGKYPRVRMGDYEFQRQALKDQASLHETQLRYYESMAAEEAVIAESRREKDRLTALEAERLQGMAAGPLRDAAELDMRRAEAARAYNEEMEDADRRYKAAGQGVKAMADWPAIDATYAAEKTRIAADRESRDALAGERESQAWKRRNREAIDELETNEKLRIEIKQQGTARAIALMEVEHQAELRALDRAGADKTNIIKRQALEAEKLMAEATRPLKDEAAQLALQIAYNRGEITAAGMARQSLFLQHPGASPEEHRLLVEKADLTERARLTGIARETRLGLHPMEQYAEFQREMTDVMGKGGLSRSDATIALRDKIKGLIGGADIAGGAFQGGVGHWQATQSALMRGSDVPAETLGEIQKLVRIMDDLNARLTRDGVRLGG